MLEVVELCERQGQLSGRTESNDGVLWTATVVCRIRATRVTSKLSIPGRPLTRGAIDLCECCNFYS